MQSARQITMPSSVFLIIWTMARIALSMATRREPKQMLRRASDERSDVAKEGVFVTLEAVRAPSQVAFVHSHLPNEKVVALLKEEVTPLEQQLLALIGLNHHVPTVPATVTCTTLEMTWWPQ